MKGLTPGDKKKGSSYTCDFTANGYRLPTEAEWEYAARGGNKSKGYMYSGSNSIGIVAWYEGASRFSVHDVKTKQPNELGLYDMSGNVWEWCWDLMGDYSSSAQTNPTGASGWSPFRVVRGGSGSSKSPDCRVYRRIGITPDNTDYSRGFRVVRTAN